MWRTFSQGTAPQDDEFFVLVGQTILFARFEDDMFLVSDKHGGTFEPNEKIFQGSLSVFIEENRETFGEEPKWKGIYLKN